MLRFLIERENEEILRPAARTLFFPDGTTHNIETYRLIWRWFDRLIECDFAPTEQRLLHYTLRCQEEEGLSLNDALVKVIGFFVQDLESLKLDVTDFDINALAAKKVASRKINNRK